MDWRQWKFRFSLKPIQNDQILEISKASIEVGYAALDNPVFYKEGVSEVWRNRGKPHRKPKK